MSTESIRRLVLQYAQQSYQEGLFAGTSGNLSCRDPETGLIAITPTSLPYPTMRWEDISLLSPTGELLQGARPSSEWPMHLELYRRLSEVGGVVHTHSPCATSFAVAGQPIPVVLIEMLYFLHGEVPLAKYQAPGTPELGEEAARALRGRTACLLQNHGVAAVGSTLEEAHLRAVYVEDAAKIYLNAKLLGTPRVIPLEEQNRIRRKAGLVEEVSL